MKISPIVLQNPLKGEEAMKKGGTIRPEQIRQAQKLLNELPAKDNRKTREEVAGILEKDFRKAFKKGYTPQELSMILKNAGIIIPAYLTKKFLNPENENPQPKVQAQNSSKDKDKNALPTGQFAIIPDTHLEDL